MKEYYFNVLIYNYSTRDFEPYDVIPYIVTKYNDMPKKKRPVLIKEFMKFVDDELRYMYWSRCQYELILSDWPRKEVEKKIDIYQQCQMNINLIASIAALELENKYSVKFKND